MVILRWTAGFFGAAAVLGLLTAATSGDAMKSAESAMTADGMLQTIKVLASDEYEGRGPGTPGEDKTVAYLVDQCKKLGLAPGNPDGTYLQNVGLWGVRSSGSMEISGVTMKNREDYLVYTVRPEAKIDLENVPLVFAGYGVTAPERQWDDYAGVDVKGKAVLILTGDPFGKTLTTYGRSYTKADVAFQKGAVALLTVYMPRPGRSGIAGMVQNYGRENMILRDENSKRRMQVQGLMSLEKARELLPHFDELRASADKPGFHAVPVDGKMASFHLTNQVREINSKNVVAKITGNSEYVIYSGHWDHLGRDGNNIYHGASDNAAGAAGVLELAKAFKKIKPQRTVIFLWPTAEEKGLLGAKWYVQHPLYPLAQTVANINLDYFSNWGWGKTKDFSVLRLGSTTLDDYARDAVEKQGRKITDDTAPSEGFYFRSDHYEFAKVGVPAMEMSPGIEYVGKPEGWGEQQREGYIRGDYHKTSDVVKPDWDLSGAIQDLDVLFEVGARVANESAKPTWKTPWPK